MPVTITTLLTGTVAPLGAAGAVSAIDKQPTTAREQVAFTGLVNDRQADRKHHGGRDKALHHYPGEHYPWWLATLGAKAAGVCRAGGFGENLSTTGMDEATVCLGDVYRVGSTVLQVSQARQPCWKLNLRFVHPEMARLLQETLRTGWYYRVLEEGWLQAGDAITLLERPHPDWPLARLLGVLYHDGLNRGLLEEMATLAPLAESWRTLLHQRLATGRIEAWGQRLYGNP